jgi:signal transduction histidine kinase
MTRARRRRKPTPSAAADGTGAAGRGIDAFSGKPEPTGGTMQNEVQGKIEVLLAEKKDFRHQIRELKFQRDLQETLLNCVPDGMVVLDSKDRPVFINQSAVNLLSLADADPREREDFSRGVLAEIIQNTKSRDFLSYHRELEILDPCLKYLSVSCIPYARNEREAYRIYYLKDITREKMAGEQAGLSPDFMDNLTFGAGIAHELGNPIAGLSVHAQILKRLLSKPSSNDADERQIRSSVEVLNKELGRLDDTIHRFLDAVRPTNPRFSLHGIGELIAQVADVVREKALEKGVSLEVEPPSSGDEPFLIDGFRIRQAVSNVLHNAVDATPPGKKVTIRIRFRKNGCEIRIQDEGRGIPPADVQRIFDPYYTTKESGNGLGLLVTYRVVKDHGGTISVKSNPGRGTEFVLTIPVRRKAVKMLPRVQGE